MTTKKVIFAMVEAGGGHRSPAKAVMDSLLQLFPGRYEARLMDFMKDLGCLREDERHKREWNWMLAHPRFTKAGYHLANSFKPITRVALKASYVLPFVPYVERFLTRESPDLLFCTHFMPAMAAIEARRRSGSSCKIVTFCSETFGVHAFWEFQGSDLYIVASRQAHSGLVRAGLARETIETFPYPLSPDFLRSRRPAEVVRRELGLDPARTTLLVSFGGQGIGDVPRYLAALEAAGLLLNVIVVTGRNAPLRARLQAERAKRNGHLNVVALGFVSSMNELLAASDLCFIKPGAATTMEALHSRKPIIFFDYATPSEKWNIDYALARGVGVAAKRSVRRLVEAVRSLIQEPSRDAIARGYDALVLENGAEPIARRLDRLLGEAPESPAANGAVEAPRITRRGA